MTNRIEILFLALEVFSGKRFIKGRWSWEGSADGAGLRLVSHGDDDDDNRLAYSDLTETSALFELQPRAVFSSSILYKVVCERRGNTKIWGKRASKEIIKVTWDDHPS